MSHSKHVDFVTRITASSAKMATIWMARCVERVMRLKDVSKVCAITILDASSVKLVTSQIVESSVAIVSRRSLGANLVSMQVLASSVLAISYKLMLRQSAVLALLVQTT